MRISARCDYACKALLELSLRWPSKDPIHINQISKAQGIPMKYLVQILIQLKRMGLVESVRGSKGGYGLTRPPNQINLGEVIREICGPLVPVAVSVSENKTIFSAIWKDIEKNIAGTLDGITFEDISNKAKGMKKAIVYQI